MKIKAFDIDWCIEEEDLEDIHEEDFATREQYLEEVTRQSAEIKASLPAEIEVTVDEEDAEQIANAISDKVGWLMYTFDYKVM